MKKFILGSLLLLAGSALTLQAAAPRVYEPRMPRRIQIARNIASVLAKNGKPDFEIVCVPNGAARFAAREAAAVLSKAFGTVIKFRYKATGKRPAIIIGDAKLAAKHGIDVSKFDRDGFAIRTIGKNILIVGRDANRDPLRSTLNYGVMPERGSLYGTYDFLERFAGVRFYFPGEMGVVIPPMKEWALPSINIYDRPDHHQRRLSYGPAVFDGLPKDSKARHYQYLRLGTMGIANCHGLAVLQFIDRFARSNPEYFALQANGLRHFDKTAARPSSRNGHICFSSGIKQVIVEDAVAFLNNKDAKSRGLTYWSWSRYPKGMPFFNIMPNDCCYPCQCARCKPHFDKGVQAGSDFIWKFFVDIANEVKKRKVKGDLTTMAYGNFREIPPFDIPDNILVMLALRGPWNELNQKAMKKDMELLKAWTGKLKAKTWLWTYPHKLHLEPGIPNYAPHAVGKFYQQTAPYTFGAYMEAETDVFLFSAMNYYIFSRVAWNNKTDVKAVMKEYFQKMYGKAASEMEQFSAMLEKQWLTCVGRSVETPEGPKTFFPSSVELWTKYYGESFFKKANALFDKGEQKLKNDKASLKRLRFMREKFFGKMSAAKEVWLKTVSAKGHWNAVMPENKWSKPIHLLPVRDANTGRILPIEVSTVVRMKRDAKNFYFKFDCEEPHTGKIIAPKRPRDYAKLWLDNTVEVHLDPAGTGKERYQFIVSSSGAIQDIKIAGPALDFKWNSPGARSRVTVKKDRGFTIELTVPRKDLPGAVPGKFTANFNRCRVLQGVSAIPHYTWSVFARTFGDQENFGRIFFEEKKVNEIFSDSGFTGRISGRWMGKWYSERPFVKDKKIFLTRGESVKLTDHQLLGQYVDFKRDQEYILSFWVKLSEKASLNVRIDERNGHSMWVPRQKMQGPQEWIRQEFRFRTHKKVPAASKKGKGYIRFQAFGKNSSVWVSDASLVEVK